VQGVRINLPCAGVGRGGHGGARFGEPADCVRGSQRRVPADRHRVALAGGPLQAGRTGDSSGVCRQARVAAVACALDVPRAVCGESIDHGVPGAPRLVGAARRREARPGTAPRSGADASGWRDRRRLEYRRRRPRRGRDEDLKGNEFGIN